VGRDDAVAQAEDHDIHTTEYNRPDKKEGGLRVVQYLFRCRHGYVLVIVLLCLACKPKPVLPLDVQKPLMGKSQIIFAFCSNSSYYGVTDTFYVVIDAIVHVKFNPGMYRWRMPSWTPLPNNSDWVQPNTITCPNGDTMVLVYDISPIVVLDGISGHVVSWHSFMGACDSVVEGR